MVVVQWLQAATEGYVASEHWWLEPKYPKACNRILEIPLFGTRLVRIA